MALADAADAARDEYERVMALTPDLDNGRRVYLTCAVCHRPEGWGSVDGAYPQIAGQAPAIIVKQLADIRAHNRDNPLMYPFSVPRILGGPQHLADVAAYVAGLPMTPHNGVGPGRDLDLGEQLYRDTCADCHGAQGEGNAQTLTPALAGQHYPYLLRQLEAMRVGRRKNAHEEMAARISAFTPREAAAVLDYAARLRPPADKVAKDGWLNPDFPAYVREPMGLPPMPPMPAPPAQPAVAPRSAGAGG
ncbi:c-type cytochrome [Thiocystis violacea]|uniref:c-type cytochrome n=1 Tax=Thiocystis violacea TaxID=13725 RepID=UPI001F5BAA2C|nr:c-type cytochrome [Thiocystis violacea]